MKKLFLTLMSLSVLGISTSVAQFFELHVDTAYLTTNGSDDDDPDDFVTIKNYIKNVSSEPITFKWRLINYAAKPSSWIYNGFCDNITCYPGGTGWTTGNTYESATVNPGDSSDFKLQMTLRQSTAENTTYVFNFEVRVGSQVENAYFSLTKNALSINAIPLDDNRVSIFPNPTKSIVNIFINKSLNAEKIVLYNLLGQIVYSQHTDNDKETYTIATDRMPLGQYLVQVYNKSGVVITTRAFSKI